MSRKIDISRFESLVGAAEKYNSSHPGKRFYPIQTREGKILIFGMYDYKTKKYSVSKPFEDVNKIFDEIEQMLKRAKAL
jgi:hypothetical protein